MIDVFVVVLIPFLLVVVGAIIGFAKMVKNLPPDLPPPDNMSPS